MHACDPLAFARSWTNLIGLRKPRHLKHDGRLKSEEKKQGFAQISPLHKFMGEQNRTGSREHVFIFIYGFLPAPFNYLASRP